MIKLYIPKKGQPKSSYNSQKGVQSTAQGAHCRSKMKPSRTVTAFMVALIACTIHANVHTHGADATERLRDNNNTKSYQRQANDQHTRENLTAQYDNKKNETKRNNIYKNDKPHTSVKKSHTQQLKKGNKSLKLHSQQFTPPRAKRDTQQHLDVIIAARVQVSKQQNVYTKLESKILTAKIPVQQMFTQIDSIKTRVSTIDNQLTYQNIQKKEISISTNSNNIIVFLFQQLNIVDTANICESRNLELTRLEMFTSYQNALPPNCQNYLLRDQLSNTQFNWQCILQGSSYYQTVYNDFSLNKCFETYKRLAMKANKYFYQSVEDFVQELANLQGNIAHLAVNRTHLKVTEQTIGCAICNGQLQQIPKEQEMAMAITAKYNEKIRNVILTTIDNLETQYTNTIMLLDELVDTTYLNSEIKPQKQLSREKQVQYIKTYYPKQLKMYASKETNNTALQIYFDALAKANNDIIFRNFIQQNSFKKYTKTQIKSTYNALVMFNTILYKRIVHMQLMLGVNLHSPSIPHTVLISTGQMQRFSQYIKDTFGNVSTQQELNVLNIITRLKNNMYFDISAILQDAPTVTTTQTMPYIASKPAKKQTIYKNYKQIKDRRLIDTQQPIIQTNGAILQDQATNTTNSTHTLQLPNNTEINSTQFLVNTDQLEQIINQRDKRSMVGDGIAWMFGLASQSQMSKVQQYELQLFKQENMLQAEFANITANTENMFDLIQQDIGSVKTQELNIIKNISEVLETQLKVNNRVQGLTTALDINIKLTNIYLQTILDINMLQKAQQKFASIVSDIMQKRITINVFKPREIRKIVGAHLANSVHGVQVSATFNGQQYHVTYKIPVLSHPATKFAIHTINAPLAAENQNTQISVQQTVIVDQEYKQLVIKNIIANCINEDNTIICDQQYVTIQQMQPCEKQIITNYLNNAHKDYSNCYNNMVMAREPLTTQYLIHQNLDILAYVSHNNTPATVTCNYNTTTTLQLKRGLNPIKLQQDYCTLTVQDLTINIQKHNNRHTTELDFENLNITAALIELENYVTADLQLNTSYHDMHNKVEELDIQIDKEKSTITTIQNKIAAAKKQADRFKINPLRVPQAGDFSFNSVTVILFWIVVFILTAGIILCICWLCNCLQSCYNITSAACNILCCPCTTCINRIRNRQLNQETLHNRSTANARFQAEQQEIELNIQNNALRGINSVQEVEQQQQQQRLLPTAEGWFFSNDSEEVPSYRHQDGGIMRYYPSRNALINNEHTIENINPPTPIVKQMNLRKFKQSQQNTVL